MKVTVVLKRILSYTRPYLWYLVGALLCALLNVALTLLAPVLVGDSIDFIIAKGQVDFPSIARILFVLAGAILLRRLLPVGDDAVHQSADLQNRAGPAGADLSQAKRRTASVHRRPFPR